MDVSSFLFPHDLEVTPVEIDKALFIGTCLSEAAVHWMRKEHPQRTLDFILFNNAAELPDLPNDHLRDYKYQYIQLSIRSIFSDAATRIVDFDGRFGAASLYDLGRKNIDSSLRNALKYHRQAGLLTLVSGFLVPQGRMSPSLRDARGPSDISAVIARLNDYLAQSVAQLDNAYFVDIDLIGNTLGKQFFLDDMISFGVHNSLYYDDWHYFEGLRIEPVPPMNDVYQARPQEYFRAVSRQIEVMYRSIMRIDAVKLVVFDLDNTLWRGQLVEDYRPEGERPGTAGWPHGVWDAISQLRWRGVLTAIASKNDLHLVEKMWDEVIDPPFLKLSDFLVKKIDWRPKAENIRDILGQTSLTAKSAVFVDDNPVEREAVKAAMPDIRVIGSNPFLTRRVLLWSAETQAAFRSNETKEREAMLGKQMEREADRLLVSHDAFLEKLDSEVRLWTVNSSSHASFGRVLELINKTNQFNTSGVRRSFEELCQLFSDGGRIYAFSVKDIYTEYGIVGAIVVMDDEIIQFVMSCRVLGMAIEPSVLAVVCDEIRSGGHPHVRATIVETEANTPCRTLYVDAGFRREDAGRFRLQGNVVVSRKIRMVSDH